VPTPRDPIYHNIARDPIDGWIGVVALVLFVILVVSLVG